MAGKKVKARVGDVFRIPISERESGFGQIIANYKGTFLMVIFSQKAINTEQPSIDEITSSSPLFICNSFDALIWHGDWPILGNSPPNHTRFPLPNYKVGMGGEMWIENYFADRARPARPTELGKLSLRQFYSPAVLEERSKRTGVTGNGKTIMTR